MTPRSGTDPIRRLRLELEGRVQGVGFRPFVWRLAREQDVGGWISNTSQGVRIEIEGPPDSLDRFRLRLRSEAPPLASIRSWAESELPVAGDREFAITVSDAGGTPSSPVLPDLATCADCLRDVLEPGDRREGYPFTNCTCCGPRFSIVRSLPYDRPRTTLAAFPLCAACRAEYDDPADRRFHAQPTACPRCGPALTLWEADGTPRESGAEALARAVSAVREGKIVAVKGLGGFHLVADATSPEAVSRLRRRKRREEKPLAVLVATLDDARAIARVGPEAEALLVSPQAPIVLLPRRPDAAVAAEVAPGNPRLGVFLPPTPLHHLLARGLGRPAVATSGNLTDEPICIDEVEALSRLAGVADLFLVHDRPIARHVDDSVAFFVDGAPALIRRARGYAPEPIRMAGELPPLLAVGAHLKSTIAVSVGRQVIVSQHVGDLETQEAFAAFEQVIGDFLDFHGVRPVAIAHDLHPDYLSTQWARAGGVEGRLAGIPRVPVQHHHAHLAACLAEHDLSGPALGVTWDGTGYGGDGTIWGGEFLSGDAGAFRRVGHLLPFPLPGGEAAVREPRRTAYSLLRETFGDNARGMADLPPMRACTGKELGVLDRLLDRGVLSPTTTSAGRLFDGIASLAGVRQSVRYEGQAAMELEWASGDPEDDPYPLPLIEGDPAILDWRPLVAEVVRDVRAGVPRSRIASRFHGALVDAIVAVAVRVGLPRVALSGGCFQNRVLTEGTSAALRRSGFEVVMHRQLPANDGSICLGQIAVAAARIRHGG